jgi:D-alanyl-lipoteichoic acid acyltransferase DltB (MBOAT superfamily)
VTVLGVLVPTAVSMLVIGAWHGGRWTYIVFGLLHATYMVVAEAWLFWRKKNRKRKGAAAPSRMDHVRGHALTILCVLVALVPFRTADMASALRIWGAMVGLDGSAVWLTWPVMAPVGAGLVAVELVVALFIVYALPNTAQWLDRLEPSLPLPVGTRCRAGCSAGVGGPVWAGGW